MGAAIRNYYTKSVNTEKRATRSDIDERSFLEHIYNRTIPILNEIMGKASDRAISRKIKKPIKMREGAVEYPTGVGVRG